jgi:hypothetical protein
MTIQEAIKDLFHDGINRVAEDLNTGIVIGRYMSLPSLTLEAILSHRWITRDSNNSVAAERAKVTA